MPPLIRSDAPQVTYPPPSNAVIGQSRAPNPYAQQNVGAVPVQGNYNSYAQQEPYGGAQYGQQQGYDQGGYANGASAVAGGDDFWGELSSTNNNLSSLQEQIQAVRSAHQQSLVCHIRLYNTALTPDIDRSRCGRLR